MNDTQDTLEADYCPPLDPTLVYSILSDYDLTSPTALEEARATLNSIKQSALDADTSLFDPSGTSAPGDVVSTSERAESCPEERGLPSNGTELTSLSNGISSLGLSESASESDTKTPLGDYMENVDKSDDQTKLLELRTMFPESTEFTILHTLKICRGNFVRAMDELLNKSFLDGDGSADGEYAIASKGVEAFSDDSPARRGRRKAGKKNKHPFCSLNEVRSASTPTSPTESPWQAGARGIEFITSRTKVSHNTVASLFHQHGTSLPATIEALLVRSAEQHKSQGIHSDEAVIQAQAYELGRDFPNINPTHVAELIRLTHPSTAAAHELAKAMITMPSKQGFVEVIPRYAPIVIDDPVDGESRTNVTSKTRLAPNAQPADAAALASTYSAASSRAYTQASVAYRRGRSDHLMSAAAGYYSQVGRDLAAQSKEATAAAADQLVAANSTPGHIDLHGVSVKDAVRIARAKTDGWWRTHKRKAVGVDGRVRAEEANGGDRLVIVTGLGRHSRGGKGLIGPAVGRMLMQEGYEARCGEGYWMVLGKR